jgi:hypothetical protein
MPDPSRRNLLSDPILVEQAQRKADENKRSLRAMVPDSVRDGVIYQDRETGEKRSLPNKFLRAIGAPATFELVDIELEMAPTDILD